MPTFLGEDASEERRSKQWRTKKAFATSSRIPDRSHSMDKGTPSSARIKAIRRRRAKRAINSKDNRPHGRTSKAKSRTKNTGERELTKNKLHYFFSSWRQWNAVAT